jgi:hypothetical protein
MVANANPSHLAMPGQHAPWVVTDMATDVTALKASAAAAMARAGLNRASRNRCLAGPVDQKPPRERATGGGIVSAEASRICGVEKRAAG